ncbi:MAG: alpha/beta hydrolase [Pseudomonadota bacterium]
MDHRFCATPFGTVYCWSVGSGAPLLLLHQASQSSVEGKALADHLADEFQVIGFDYPGHGWSEDPARELEVEDYAAVALAVLDEFGVDRAHVCGHHSGGILTIKLAADHAERVSTAVISGIGVRSEEIVRAVLDTPMTRDLPVDADGDFLQKTWSVYRRMSSPGLTPEQTYAFFIEGLSARSRPYDAHFAFIRWDWGAAAKRLRQPALLIYGEHDHFVESPEAIAADIQNSETVWVKDGGIFLFYEQPAASALEIRRFILAQ